MAAEAQAEGPALAAAAPPPPPPPPPAHGASSASPGKRGLPIPTDDDGAEELQQRRLPEPKRRRARVAALDGVPCAAEPTAAEGGPGSCSDGDGDGACFSFPHARDGFAALETTPKFGSFNPPGEAELPAAGTDLKPAEPRADAEADDEVPAASAREAEVQDDSWQLVGSGEVDGLVQK